MITVISVIGTRPEAIKMAPLIHELARFPSRIRSLVCVTAQHREMLDQVLDLFGITPDYDLDIMRQSQSPTSVAAAILFKLEPVLKAEDPDWVLVQGDTTTAMAAAIAAFYKRVRVGHVEAGLRTFDKWQPYPEEVNRRIAGVVADRHFAPTENARSNLRRENVPDNSILVTGNTVIDALQWVSDRELSPEVAFGLREMGLGWMLNDDDDTRTILVTAHRRENHGESIRQICLALKDISEQYAETIRIVYPVHPNPNVAEPVIQHLAGVPGILLTPPLEYLQLVHLMKRAHIVLTDSGGLQEEAPGLGKPVLVLRETTERPEGVEAGTVKLVGTHRSAIVRETRRLLDSPDAYRAMATSVNPYGDGHASSRIVRNLLNDSKDHPSQVARAEFYRLVE